MRKPIELYRCDNQLMNDAIDRIIVEIHSHKKQEGKKSLLLSGCSSASGTTMIAIDIAIALAMAGWKTLFVDCDFRKGTEYKRLNNIVESGLTDYLSGKTEENKVIQETNYEKLDYIASGNGKASPTQLLCSTRMESLIKTISPEYDYIIYDFPSLNIVSDAMIFLPYMDGIMLVAALEKATKKQLRDAKRKVEKYKENYYGLIVNQVDMPQYRNYIKDFDYFKEQNLSRLLKENLKKKKRIEK
ncbi:MAG: CpsD/CapB family tyrosine-protein kinase [bacterium]|nr:CpsD/CapB family tyrosine-protein kinase [bacterium]